MVTKMAQLASQGLKPRYDRQHHVKKVKASARLSLNQTNAIVRFWAQLNSSLCCATSVATDPAVVDSLASLAQMFTLSLRKKTSR
jgi:hypothetical protein